MSEAVRLWKSYCQYLFLGALLVFDVIMIQSPPLWARLTLAVALILSPLVPYVRRFTVPCLPIFTWLITFYASQFIPETMRPRHIFVNLLPTLERILYGANLSEILSRHSHPVLDILAWLPYGIIHFVFPFLLSLMMFIFGPPGSLKVFAKAFGYMNLAGVLTQLLLPCASPWYELSYNSAPATYAVPGQPGGLERIDVLLGIKLYSSTFGNSPLVFGAFPSLHSGCATMEMLFMSYLFPNLWPLGVAYVMWMWWATMYLTHHYLIDLVGGAIYTLVIFTVYWHTLPVLKPGARTRLDYFELPASLGTFISTIEMDVPREWHEKYVDPDCDFVAVDFSLNDENAVELQAESVSWQLERLDIASLHTDLSSRPASLRLSCTSPSTLSEPSTPCSVTSINLPISHDKDFD